MRLVDFLVLLLTAHADALKRLAAFFGEENLVAILEDAGEAFDDRRLAGLETAAPAITAIAKVTWLPSSTSRANSQAYRELEGTVRELGLPEVLEFHLWAYPHYRAFIESALNLDDRLPPGGGEFGPALIEAAYAGADEWIRTLPIPAAVATAAYKAAQIPWIRFRTEALKKMGRRPLGAV